MEAIIHPLLKKINLNLLDKNYHPVSNLSFLSKALECTVALQLVEYVDSNDLMEPNQSAYRRNHSTETTLLKIKSDIIVVMDEWGIVCLLLSHLSAAFDTVDPTILLDCLYKCFVFDGTILTWTDSYLSNRTQCVAIGNLDLDVAMPDPVTLTFGVPQGSVLSLTLFTLYTSLLGDICRAHGIEFQQHADDQQVYLSFKPIRNNSAAQNACLKRLQKCVRDIQIWMNLNMLKLNDDKTEFIMFGMKQQLAKINRIDITSVVPPYGLLSLFTT